MATFDFEMAKVYHRRWRLSVEEYLDGLRAFDEDEMLYCTDCELGHWLEDYGMPTFGTLPEMQELMQMHAELHSRMPKIVELVKAGHRVSAHEEWAHIVPLSEHILILLDTVEARIMIS
ncbi:MAG: CZB domain-containing protein [Anaerolineae bacterium]|nr:CZB domain-containing protein [Anaerolineae bacterium]